MTFIFIFFGSVFGCWCHPRVRSRDLIMRALKHQGVFVGAGVLLRGLHGLLLDDPDLAALGLTWFFKDFYAYDFFLHCSVDPPQCC